MLVTAAWSAAWFPHATSMLPFWCPLQWEIETSIGSGLCLQEPKDLITVLDGEHLGIQVASFFPDSSMCM